MRHGRLLFITAALVAASLPTPVKAQEDSDDSGKGWELYQGARFPYRGGGATYVRSLTYNGRPVGKQDKVLEGLDFTHSYLKPKKDSTLFDAPNLFFNFDEGTGSASGNPAFSLMGLNQFKLPLLSSKDYDTSFRIGADTNTQRYVLVLGGERNKPYRFSDFGIPGKNKYANYIRIGGSLKGISEKGSSGGRDNTINGEVYASLYASHAKYKLNKPTFTFEELTGSISEPDQFGNLLIWGKAVKKEPKNLRENMLYTAWTQLSPLKEEELPRDANGRTKLYVDTLRGIYDGFWSSSYNKIPLWGVKARALVIGNIGHAAGEDAVTAGLMASATHYIHSKNDFLNGTSVQARVIAGSTPANLAQSLNVFDLQVGKSF